MRKNPENPWYGDPNGHRIAALMRWGKLPHGEVGRYRKRGRPSTHGFVVKPRRKHVARKHVARKRKHVSLGLARMHSAMASGAGQYRHRKGFASVFGEYRPGGRAFSHNPFLGRSFMRKRKRSKHRKHNTWFGQIRRHRKAARLGWKRGHVGVKRRKRNPAVGAVSNPIRHRRRHRRHNPALGATFKQFTSGVMNVRDWAPLAVTGAV